MKQRRNHPSRVAATRSGYTLLEFIVAMVVFGVALTGLMPLVAILSRDLQPQMGQRGTTPARDWNTDTCQQSQHTRTTWYLTPYDDSWVRRLGVSARVTAGSVSSASQSPVQSPVLFLDDYDPSGSPVTNSSDGTGTYASAGWEYNGSAASAFAGDQHRKAALPAGSSSTGEAVWTFKILTPGYYSIQTTWTAGSDRVNDAQYRVYKNGVLQMTTTVDQTAAPVGVTSNGCSWASLTTSLASSLGLIQLAANDVIEVHLSDVRATSPAPGFYVVADAARIVQNAVTLTSIERSLSGANKNSNNADVTAKVSVTVSIPQ
jgi:prepilin-type N-terminal cleavage/methylation domain-containing protein